MPLDALEYIVRPYQTPGVHGAIIIPSTPRDTRERATLTWGGGPAKPPARKEVSDGVNFEVVCCKEGLNEQSRESETKQIPITQEQIDQGYFETERPTTLKLQKKEHNKCGDDWDQFSGVGQEVSDTLAEFDAAIHSGTTASGDKNCSVGWKFKNQ